LNETKHAEKERPPRGSAGKVVDLGPTLWDRTCRRNARRAPRRKNPKNRRRQRLLALKLTYSAKNRAGRGGERKVKTESQKLSHGKATIKARRTEEPVTSGRLKDGTVGTRSQLLPRPGGVGALRGGEGQKTYVCLNQGPSLKFKERGERIGCFRRYRKGGAKGKNHVEKEDLKMNNGFYLRGCS